MCKTYSRMIVHHRSQADPSANRRRLGRRRQPSQRTPVRSRKEQRLALHLWARRRGCQNFDCRQPLRKGQTNLVELVLQLPVFSLFDSRSLGQVSRLVLLRLDLLLESWKEDHRRVDVSGQRDGQEASKGDRQWILVFSICTSLVAANTNLELAVSCTRCARHHHQQGTRETHSSASSFPTSRSCPASSATAKLGTPLVPILVRMVLPCLMMGEVEGEGTHPSCVV